MPEDRDSELPHLWKDQAHDLASLSLDAVRRRSRMLERRVRQRNYGEYAAALIAVAVITPAILSAPNVVLRAGAAVLLAGIAYVVYRLHISGSAQTMPSDLGVRSCVDFQRAELQRQRDLLQNVWSWYLLPLWPGMVLILIGGLSQRPDRWPLALGVAIAAVLMSFHIAWMNRRSAKSVQDIIDGLEENPVVTVRSDPPSLTLAQRVSVWVLTSFLAATALGFVMGRFLPETKAHIFGLAALPRQTRDVLFVLVVAGLGVAVQALWWMIRRR